MPAAQGRYHDFLRRHQDGWIVYLELGVGMNTPVIIKYPFWNYTSTNPQVTYICANLTRAGCPAQIASQSICVNADIGKLLTVLL